MDLAFPHERMLLDLQVRSQFGLRRLSSVAELCERLVLFIQAFFAFLGGNKVIQKANLWANAEDDDMILGLWALSPSDQVVCVLLWPAGGEVE